MARTLGATNKTPRELRTEAKHLTDKARDKERIEKLKKAQEEKK